MTVIEKTIKVPKNRQFTLEFPEEIAVGETADITVTVNQPVEKTVKASILDLAGAFADSKTFAGDSVALIREIRDEW